MTYQNVPEFVATGANTFSITLQRSSNHIDINYGSSDRHRRPGRRELRRRRHLRFELPTNLPRQQRPHGPQEPAGGLRAVRRRQPPRPREPDGEVQRQGHDFDDDFENNDSLAPRDAHRPAVQHRGPGATSPRSSRSATTWTTTSSTPAPGSILVVEVVRGEHRHRARHLRRRHRRPAGRRRRRRRRACSRACWCRPTRTSTSPSRSRPSRTSTSRGDGDGGGRYVLQVNHYQGTVAGGRRRHRPTPVNLGFTFPFQGSNWTSVFVNSNGNLTFGAGSTDFCRDRGRIPRRPAAHRAAAGTTSTPATAWSSRRRTTMTTTRPSTSSACRSSSPPLPTTSRSSSRRTATIEHRLRRHLAAPTA